MHGLTILDFSQEGLNQVVSAKSATWDFRSNTWNFYNGTIYVVSPDGSYRNIVTFETQQLQLPRTPFDLASRTKSDTEMNIAESVSSAGTWCARAATKKKKKRSAAGKHAFSKNMPYLSSVWCLVWWGLPSGVLPQRTSRATSFGISIVIIFGYYLLAFITNAMGEVGILSPFMAAWLPTLVGLVAGLYLLFKASK